MIISGLFLALALQVPAQDTYKPAPVFSHLLSDVSVDDEGRFKLHSMYAYFLNGEKGTLKVLREGNEIAEFSFRISPYKPPQYEILGYELVSGKNDVLGLKLEVAGNYELVYYSGDQEFYRFPFELVVKKSSDPYNPKKLILLNGDWNDQAYLLRTSTESHGKWDFKLYVRSDDGKYNQSKSYLRLIRDADKKLVAVGSSNFRRERRWTRQTLTLQKPGKTNSSNEYYDNQELLANRDKFADGSYTLNLFMDEQLYGAYKFTVKDGEIQPQGRQVRESTDPLRFIEGAGSAFWMKKQ